jgi:hypothetical protein
MRTLIIGLVGGVLLWTLVYVLGFDPTNVLAERIQAMFYPGVACFVETDGPRFVCVVRPGAWAHYLGVGT